MSLPFSTNPAIMAENIRRLEDTIASVPVGKIPKDYSTSKTDTGLKWIDGSPIYIKSVSGTTGETANYEIGNFGNVVIINEYFTITKADTYVQRQPVIYETQTGTIYLQQGSGNRSVAFRGWIMYANVSSPSNELNASPSNELTASPDRALNVEPEAEPEVKKVTKKKTTKKEEEE